MRRIFKWFAFCALIASLGFTAYELKQVSKLAAEFKSGALTPAQAFERLAASDKTGAMGKLLEGQQEALARLDQAALAGGAAPVAAAAVSPPPQRAHEAPAGPRHLSYGSSSEGNRTGASGKGLMVDSSGRRFETSPEGRVPAASAVLPDRPLVLPSLPQVLMTPDQGDLESRKRRAYALLLGTVGVAAAGLLVAKRVLKG